LWKSSTLSLSDPDRADLFNTAHLLRVAGEENDEEMEFTFSGRDVRQRA